MSQGMTMAAMARAARAASDLARPPSGSLLESIACMGASGRQESHQERDFHSAARRNTHINTFGLEECYIELPLRKQRERDPELTRTAVLAPHEVLAAMATAGELQCQVSLYGPDGEQGVRA
eukprot:14880453-Alexandrium_andersonii.AAC.1